MPSPVKEVEEATTDASKVKEAHVASVSASKVHTGRGTGNDM